MDPFGILFIPVGVTLLYYGAPAITDPRVRRKRVEDEKRRDLITRGGARLGEPSERREAALGWIAVVFGVAFVIGGLSMIF